MADLIPLKAGRNICGHCDLNNIFPKTEVGTFVETYQSVWLSGIKDGCKLRPQKPLLDLTFCICLVREILLLSRKSHGKVRKFWKGIFVATKVNKRPAWNNVLYFFFQVVFAVYGTLFGIVGLFKLRSKSKKESPAK